MTGISRRRFLSSTAVVALVARAPAWIEAWQDDLWSTAADILRRVKDPVFPVRDVDVTAHGAKGDGGT